MRKNKWTAILTGMLFLAISLFGTSSLVFAESVTETPLMTVQSNTWKNWPQGPEVTPEAAIVMDMETGTVLYAKNIYDAHYPASITKIMTALIAVENGSPDQIVGFSYDAIHNVEGGSASCGMMVGEWTDLDTTLRCMMSQSANECAYAIAETVGGTYDQFIQMMNDEAKRLGCVNSHFSNPHGLHDETHYVCAYDMALIAKEAYNSEWFRDFCMLTTYQRPLTESNPDVAWTITNRHQMMHPGNQYYYEGITGGKTGFTDQAKSTLVTFAEQNGRKLVSVVLAGAGVEVYYATAATLDYGFSQFENLPIIDLVDREVVERVFGDARITVPLGTTKKDLTEKMEEGRWNKARVSYQFQDMELGGADVTLCYSYLKESQPKEGILETESEIEEKQAISVYLYIIGAIFAVAIVAFVYAAICLRKIKKREIEKTLQSKEE